MELIEIIKSISSIILDIAIIILLGKDMWKNKHK